MGMTHQVQEKAGAKVGRPEATHIEDNVGSSAVRSGWPGSNPTSPAHKLCVLELVS